jgi:hypothetical protein
MAINAWDLGMGWNSCMANGLAKSVIGIVMLTAYRLPFPFCLTSKVKAN